MLSLLNNEEVMLPEELVQSEEIFREVLKKGIQESLNDTEKRHLMCFLPSSGKTEAENVDLLFFEETLNKVFEGSSNFKHGDPLKHAYLKLQSGLLTPKVVELQKKCLKLKERNYKLNQKEYYKNLLEEIILSRQRLLGRAYAGKPPLKRHPSDIFAMVKQRAKKKYKRILRDISRECGDNVTSSDEDDLLPQDNSFISEYELICMLGKHKKKRVLCQDHPELNTTNISLADLVMRCNGLKKSNLRHNNAGPNKINMSTPIHDKIIEKKKIKSKLAISHSTPPVSVVESLETKKVSKPIKCPPVIFPKMDSFFSLIGYIFDNAENKKCTLATIEEKIQRWQKYKSGDTCTWKTLYPSWVPFIPFAIEYMSGKGTASQLPEFTPLLLPDDNCWCWTGPDYTNNSIILPLCNHWMDTLGEAMAPNTNKECNKEKQDVDRTSYSVCPSSNEQKEEFRRQEKERFLKPYMPFVYTLHGYSSVAAPVKGVFKDSNFDTAKAREHAMLVSERPAYVTILSLVRDAVARLPNGEGTRAEVCLLLRDSQFLNPKATDSQVNNVVSGALDRLHAEKDPCVKFDPVRKVWLYLHRYRTVDELEKLHQASGAAVLAKKQLSSSKPKVLKMKKPEKEDKNCKVSNIKKDLFDNTLEEEINNSSESTVKSISETSINATNSFTKKKTAVKRKQINESSILKISKLDTCNMDTSNEFHSLFEDETLMATQSLMLSGEDDVFDDGVLSSNFLDLQQNDELITNSSFQSHQNLSAYNNNNSQKKEYEVPIYENRNILPENCNIVQDTNSPKHQVNIKKHFNESSVVSISTDLNKTAKHQNLKKKIIPEQLISGSNVDLQISPQHITQTIQKSVSESKDQVIINNTVPDNLVERQHVRVILNTNQINTECSRAITNANKETFQNLNQYLTSKIAQNKVVSSSLSNSSILHNTIVRANVAPFSQVIRSSGPFLEQIRVSKPLLTLQNQNNAITRLVVQSNNFSQTHAGGQKTTLKLIQVKGNNGSQVITSHPPNLQNVRTSKNDGNVHLLSLNQLISSNASQSKFTDRTVLSSVATGTCVPVASIQALLQSGQKSRFPSSHGDQPQFIVNHQNVQKNVNSRISSSLHGSSITVSNSVSNSLHGSPMSNASKILDKNMNTGKILNIETTLSKNASGKEVFTYFPGSVISRGIRPTMAPLKITLPRSGFNSPQSTNNSPIRISNVYSPRSPSFEKIVVSRNPNSVTPLRYPPPTEHLVNLKDCLKNSDQSLN
ncbi:nuclear factor related to kappa-B-binding protein isoform X2 [Hydra vulgaris]|uniref:Nuclear factor related to kappa-B-binding protein isoform X2 n=1 Tax=Hydra vulgaris TaxID=6087 RepID=A0ABM4B5S9_HYDVU